jgi:predicted Co/Zn/Cd cation transporter (cation efflux family)
MGIAPALAAMTVAAMMARLGIFIAVMCQQSCVISDGVKYLVDLVLKIIFGRL